MISNTKASSLAPGLPHPYLQILKILAATYNHQTPHFVFFGFLFSG